MIKGANSTVQVRAEAISALDVICTYHKISKTELVTFVVMALVQYEPDEVEMMIRAGKFLALIVSLGGKIQYPEGIEIAEGETKDILRGVK